MIDFHNVKKFRWLKLINRLGVRCSELVLSLSKYCYGEQVFASTLNNDGQLGFVAESPLRI